MLTNRLPSDASDANSDISNAIVRATSFVDTWAYKYDPFDDYQASPEVILAPAVIGEIALEVAEAYYFMGVAQRQRDGDTLKYYDSILIVKRDELRNANITPVWIEQTVALDSNDCMIIGDRTVTGGMWPRVIPFTAQIINGSTVYVMPDDFTIRKGGANDNEYPDAWYLDTTESSSVAGTLRYMRTYRNDSHDYMRYTNV